jgi:sec-independent protein translocase protein TatA
MLVSILLFLNIGGPELFVIAIAFLILFGPEKMPEIARTMGKYVREFRNAMNGVQDEIKQAMKEPLEEIKRPPDSIPQNPTETKPEPEKEKIEEKKENSKE